MKENKLNNTKNGKVYERIEELSSQFESCAKKMAEKLSESTLKELLEVSNKDAYDSLIVKINKRLEVLDRIGAKGGVVESLTKAKESLEEAKENLEEVAEKKTLKEFLGVVLKRVISIILEITKFSIEVIGITGLFLVRTVTLTAVELFNSIVSIKDAAINHF